MRARCEPCHFGDHGCGDAVEGSDFSFRLPQRPQADIAGATPESSAFAPLIARRKSSLVAISRAIVVSVATC